MKKVLLSATCALLLAGCSATKTGYEVYGNENGGWDNSVNITDLEATKYTKEFNKDTNEVVYFALNSATLDAIAKDDLKGQVDWLKENPKALVVIEGRCDERGTREYNLALGDRRANIVRSYLIANGIKADRIRTISYGKDKPVDDGHDEQAWAKNRSATTVAY